MFIKKTLPLVVGSKKIEEALRQINSKIHVYGKKFMVTQFIFGVGHTHIKGDKVIDGVRYVQNPLGHPTEQNKFWASADLAPKLIYDSSEEPSATRCTIS
jgi:hypothetical protein